MRRGQRLDLARARTRNALSKTRVAGTTGGEDARDHEDAQRHLNLALAAIERMIDRDRRA